MKFTAVLLLCSLFIISFAGMIKPVSLAAKKTCCQHTNSKKVCREKKTKHDDGCTKQGCATLLTCSICAFLTEQPVHIGPGYSLHYAKPVSLYIAGELSAYHKADWKPPKTC